LHNYSCAGLSAAHAFLTLAPVGGGSYDWQLVNGVLDLIKWP